MQRNLYTVVVVSVLIFLAACKKDKPDPGTQKLPPVSVAKVLLVCEGSLGNGNASLGVYDLATDSVYADVYAAANGRSLGDVFQSVCGIGNQYWLAVNNSDQIQIVDTGSFRTTATIAVSKPRYILPLSAGKGIVGELFRNKLGVLDFQSRSLTRELSLPRRNAEGLLKKGAYIWTACWDETCNQIYLLDTAVTTVVDSIALPRYAPHTLAEDKNGNVWVLSGNVYKGAPASLLCFDASRKMVRSFLFPDQVDPIKLCLNNSRDTLYFLEVNYDGGTDRNGVFRMGITQTSLPEQPFIACQPNQYFWALGVHPHTGEIFVGDPKGFVQKSSVSLYGPDGAVHKRFNCGVGISSFYFK